MPPHTHTSAHTHIHTNVHSIAIIMTHLLHMRTHIHAHTHTNVHSVARIMTHLLQMPHPNRWFTSHEIDKLISRALIFGGLNPPHCIQTRIDKEKSCLHTEICNKDQTGSDVDRIPLTPY